MDVFSVSGLEILLVIPNRKLKLSNDDVAELFMVADDLISPGTTI
jgi:hypothetical protein